MQLFLLVTKVQSIAHTLEILFFTNVINCILCTKYYMDKKTQMNLTKMIYVAKKLVILHSNTMCWWKTDGSNSAI